MAVYPFIRSYGWYLLPPEQRSAMLTEHGLMGREHPTVLSNTVAAFALGDWEWILALEADDLHDIVDLMRHLVRPKPDFTSAPKPPSSPAGSSTPATSTNYCDDPRGPRWISLLACRLRAPTRADVQLPTRLSLTWAMKPLGLNASAARCRWRRPEAAHRHAPERGVLPAAESPCRERHCAAQR